MRILIVGVGSIGERHLRCFQGTGRVELAVCEPRAEVREATCRRYGIDESHASLGAALERPFDGAVIATPANLHVEQAIALAGRGCHVLIEKPLGTSAGRVAELLEIVSQRDLVAAVAYVYRCHPGLAGLRNALLENRFGRPLELRVAAGQPFDELRPAYREVYFRDHVTGGGAIQDAMTHFFNAGEWLCGPITAICCDAAHCKLEGVDVEDTVHAIVRHGAVRGSYALNLHQKAFEATITVVCERGVLRFEYADHCWRWTTSMEAGWQDEPLAPLERDELFARQASAFLDAVEHGAAPPCDLAAGARTLAVNLAALESSRQREWRDVGEPWHDDPEVRKR